jgi:hypothetical protein
MRFKQLIFMFALFGFNWSFAVFQNFSSQPYWMLVFAYLFNISVALQGLAYLVFFVLLHDSLKSYLEKLFFKADSSNEIGKSIDLSLTALSKDS